MSSPVISPDGRFIAAQVVSDGKKILGIFPISKAYGETALVGLSEVDVNGWAWVNNDWLVLKLGSVQSVQGRDWYISRIAGVSRDGKTIKPIAYREAGQDADDILWIANDGTPRLLLALQKSIYVGADFWPDVVEVDVTTGKTKRVVDGRTNVMRWYADSKGAVRIGVGYDDMTRTARLLYRDQGYGPFRTVDRANAGKDERLLSPALFLAEPGKALVWSDQDGYDALHQFDFGTMKVGEKLFSVDDYDIDSIVESRNGDGVSGIRYTDTRSRVRWIDPMLAKVQSDLDKAVGADRAAEILSMNQDQTKMIVLVSSSDAPGTYYFFDTNHGVMQRLAYVSGTLKGERFSPVKTIRYKARDGLEIPAILTLPRGREAKQLPLIVMPHGGPAVRDAEGWDWQVQFLASQGYVVIQPNYRGSTGFGSTFLQKGDGEWGLKMQDDLNDAVTDLAKEGIADPNRVCMVGSSYGGYAALRAAQRDGDIYRCAVSYAGVSDLAHLARFDSDSLYGRANKAYLRKKAPDFASVSPINHPSQFSAPVLLVHGKKDLRVPISQSREMAEKLQRAGKPVRYVEQPLGDHHFSREADRLQFLKELESFLRIHNPA